MQCKLLQWTLLKKGHQNKAFAGQELSEGRKHGREERGSDVKSYNAREVRRKEGRMSNDGAQYTPGTCTLL